MRNRANRNEAAEQKVVCPECGGSEFSVTCEVIATNLHPVHPGCGKKCFAFEVESVVPIEIPESTFECTNCFAELDLDAA